MRALLATLILVLPGCIDATPQPSDPDLAEATTGVLALPQAIMIGPGADAESSIDVSPDGHTILVCSHGGFTQPSPLWASVDAGATWKRIEPQPNQPFNGDCDVTIAPDGAWAIVYDTVYSATVAVSSDQGRSWNVHFITGAPVTGLDRPWLHALSRNHLYMTYKSVGAGQPEVDVFAASTDGGATWMQRPYFLPQPPQRIRVIPGDMYVTDAGKTIRVPFIVSGDQGQPRTLENAVSRDGGASWAREPIAQVPVAAGIPGGDRGPDGTLWFSYSTRVRNGTGDVVVHHSRDDGKTWDSLVAASRETFAGLLGNVWISGRPDASATAFWVTQRQDNGSTLWQHRAARIELDDNGSRVAAVGPVGPAGQPHPSNLYEFATVRHDATGRAHFAFPVVTGPSCKQTPTFPSQVGSGQVPRNAACQYVVIEEDPGLGGL